MGTVYSDKKQQYIQVSSVQQHCLMVTQHMGFL